MNDTHRSSLKTNRHVTHRCTPDALRRVSHFTSGGKPLCVFQAFFDAVDEGGTRVMLVIFQRLTAFLALCFASQLALY